jgi:hypothetical protein
MRSEESNPGCLPAAKPSTDNERPNMTAIDLGINSDSISYEVALDVLGQSRQPFMTAIREEEAKATPSRPFVRYCEARLRAIDELQDELEPSDRDTIERILAADAEPKPFKMQARAEGARVRRKNPADR